MAKKKETSKLLLTFISIFSLLIGFILGCGVSIYINKPVSDHLISGDLKIHFLELGNEYSGDCILIQIGEYDILVDAGSKTTSLNTIKNYLDTYVSDSTLEYVLVTHAHEDHYANFAGDGNTSLLSYYTTNTIIQFSKTNQTPTKGMYKNYLSMIEKEKQEGAKVYNVLECYNNQNGCTRSIDLGHNVELEILYNYYYEHEADSENNYSICFVLNQGDNHFLFTGDLEKEGEIKLLEHNTLPKMTLYKAGHHGSKTSSSKELLEVIQPEIVIFTCVAGSYEYTQKKENTFPTVEVLNNLSLYTDKMYVTSMAISELVDGKYKDVGVTSFNGNIIVNSNKNGIEVSGSNNNTLLKDSEWYLTNRASN